MEYDTIRAVDPDVADALEAKSNANATRCR